ncbi:hypothetical protein TNCV_5092131 [Trichonephila clavipes]|nr:hypothetical protein TNCV_5092131 [Trichonephila clavipes]
MAESIWKREKKEKEEEKRGENERGESACDQIRVPILHQHATQQKGKHHFRQAQHHRLSRYGIEDCSYSPDAQRTPIQRL